MTNEKIELDANTIIQKLAMKIARLEIELAQEEALKEYHIENYKILAQSESEKDA